MRHFQVVEWRILLQLLNKFPDMGMIIKKTCFPRKTSKSTFKVVTAWKVSVFGVFLVRIFPQFGLNTERYSVSPRIQSKWSKMRTRKTPNTDTFHAVCCLYVEDLLVLWFSYSSVRVGALAVVSFLVVILLGRQIQNNPKHFCSLSPQWISKVSRA